MSAFQAQTIATTTPCARTLWAASNACATVVSLGTE